MRTPWQVIYYETATGQCPVAEFIQSRSIRNQAKLLALLSFLEEQGPTLPRPYADLLADGIHELRLKLSGNQVRILYFFCYKEWIVLTHAFTKTTPAVPQAEIRTAQKYRADFLQRFRESDVRETRT